jgi:hypothetical protein
MMKKMKSLILKKIQTLFTKTLLNSRQMVDSKDLMMSLEEVPTKQFIEELTMIREEK